MERREISTAIHPDQVLAKCANGQMKTRLAVLVSGANDLKGARSQEERRFVRVIVLVLEEFCTPREKRNAK